jgi:tetratricopeptide (TPR) repeat protein
VLVQRAERLRKDGEEKSSGDSAGAWRALAAAESLLAQAQVRDPTWAEPSSLRARIALRRVRLSTAPPAASAWIDAGIRAADTALALDPRDADALEARGTLRYERLERNLSADPVEERALVRDAERDLLRATEVDPAQANAWNVLSALYYRKTPSDLTGANINARRALEADAYLAAADEVVWRLFVTSYDLGDHDEAVKWCDEGHRRFPTEARFALGRLYLGFMKGQPADVGRTWRTVDEVVALTPPARRPLVERHARILAAGTLAAAGLRDSAERVLAAARADRSVDPNGALITPEALVLVRLGRRAEAIQLLKLFLSAHPQHRGGVLRNTWWWSDLKHDPEFKAITGAG